MTKFEKLCDLCGVAPESEEGKAISNAVNEMLFGDIYYSDEEIIASVASRFRKVNTMTVYDFLIFFEGSDDPQLRYVAAYSEEEATAKLEAHYRELESQGYQYPRFITNPTIYVDYVIV